jgi:predicted AAA+ superfamily ATPase
MRYQRILEEKLRQTATQFPVVAVLGPRQSGKTTLVKATFPNYDYVSLEDLDTRDFAQSDPRGFLNMYNDRPGVIFDEIQHVPQLLSYIQTIVDKHPRSGYFVITGSQNFLINQAITQTLAGRIVLHTLLPFSIHELLNVGVLPSSLESFLFKGCYPRIYDHHLSSRDWYPSYIRTYVERDVRQIKNVTNLTTFQRFIKLCAGRIGQLLNLTSLGNDCGITTNTAKAWISLLEQSYIIFLLQPYYKNFSKSLIKAPKIYFYDTGLACSLLGIESEQQLITHYLRGGLFESCILSEMQKYYFNRGYQPRIYFWRDKQGHEVDCLIEKATTLIPIEIKAGKTASSSYFDELRYLNKIVPSEPYNNVVIYAGDEDQQRTIGLLLGWRLLSKLFDKIETV